MPESGNRGATSLYGIGEWYGLSFVALSPAERLALPQEEISLQGRLERRRCPFRSREGGEERCAKRGGVCSLRLYQREAGRGPVRPVKEETEVHTVCPYRFCEGERIFRWIGREILGTEQPTVVQEVPFLERAVRGKGRGERPSPVGRRDHVLVHSGSEPLAWCALEMQAVYFSGAKMEAEFEALAQTSGSALPLPAGRRHPDYRSSGPQRLMPQLLITVPTLRRWGKRMCVVVDRGFFDELGRMEQVSDVSSCDIA